MLLSFVPQIIISDLTELTPEMLENCGIRFLMLDFDNTIVPYTSNNPTPEMENWLQQMVRSSVGICVVSNSKRDRVIRFCQSRGIPCITHANKPFQRGIRQCSREFSLDMASTAMVGDQIFTDVLAGNLAGAVSVLVKPIHLHNIWLKLRHFAELPFIALGKRRGKT